MSELESFLKQRLRAFNPYHADRGMTYEDGLLLIAANDYRTLTKDAECLFFLRGYLERHIAPDGTILNYDLEEYNIDNILAGNVLFDMDDLTGDPRYERAADELRGQLERHPRTRSGSFWHKKRYPDQIWLDGLYMGQPFRTMYALRHGEGDVLQDVVRQVETVRRLLWDDARKLYVHACDEERRMPWSDPVTGRSPNVWSRSVGWFAMALSDLALLFLPTDGGTSRYFAELLRELLDGMLPHADEKTGMWHQVVDRPDVTGNYLETSGSAMIAYAALKAVRLGFLPDFPYGEAARRTLSGIRATKLSATSGGWVLRDICAVAGLDGTRRDGSVAYYLSEPIAENEIKGVGPFLFALIEEAKSQKS